MGSEMNHNEIEIKNYQGIEHATIGLADGITVFIGPSDSGKSAFFRCMRDYWYNCQGDGHVMVGAKKATVESCGVRWEKGKNVNRYVIDGTVYDSVGRGVVPPEVIERTRVREVGFGDDISRRLNIAEQFGAPFMIGEKVSDNAKIIGSLSGIGVVFNALREATADHRKARQDEERSKASVKQSEEQIDGYVYLASVADMLEKANELLESVRQKRVILDRLRTLVSEARSVTSNIVQQKGMIESLKSVSGISFDRYESLIKEQQVAESLVSDCNGAIKAVRDARECALRLARIDCIEFDTLEGLVGKHSTLSALGIDVGALRSKWKRVDDANKQQTVIHEQAVDALGTVIDGMDVCPLSGLVLPEQCKKALKS